MTSIPEIDTATIESLKALRDQQSVLEERLATMEGKKDSVSPTVYERVRNDYRERLDALDDEARPLEEKARREWARLREVLHRVEDLQAEARLEREELEFRHELGEFAEDEFEGEVDSIEKRLGEHESEIEEIEALRERFVAAFGSEEHLEDGPGMEGSGAPEAGEDRDDESLDEGPRGDEDEPVGAPETQPATALTDDVPADPDSRRPSESLEGLPPAPGVPPPPDATWEPEDESTPDDEATMIRPVSDPMVAEDLPLQDPDAGATRVMSTDSPVEAPEATRILRKPRLETLEGTDVGQSFVLGALPVTIGRSSDNTVHLLEEAVSRHHAELIPGPDGFLLRDLGSENGTYVNGKRKKEHFLQDGDIVQIGLRKMMFKET